jgi:hypothetical protein
MEDGGLFNGHLLYFTTIWYTLMTFGILYGHLVYFSPFWYVVPIKIWQPWSCVDKKCWKAAETAPTVSRCQARRSIIIVSRVARFFLLQ